MDKIIFMAGMKKLSDLFPDYPLKDGTMEGYWEFLEPLSNLQFERAVKAHIKQNKWFPKVSELLAAVQEQGPSVTDIWQRLLAAAESGKKPEMDAATEKALAVLGGWEVFQYTSYDDLQYRFKDFKSALLEARAKDSLMVVGSAAEQKVLEEKP